MIDCLFCKDDFYTEKNIILENNHWRAVYDGYPVSKGHTLIIPKRHISSFFDLTIYQFFSLFKIIRNTKKVLDKKFKPLAYNIGINDGSYAGQTIPHLHIHIIPRYEGDGGLPCGVRNVFKQDIANYTHNI